MKKLKKNKSKNNSKLVELFRGVTEMCFEINKTPPTDEDRDFISRFYRMIDDSLHIVGLDRTPEPYNYKGYGKRLNKIFATKSKGICTLVTGVDDNGREGDDIRYTAFMKHKDFKKGKLVSKSFDNPVEACAYRLKLEKKVLKKSNLSEALLVLSSAFIYLRDNAAKYLYERGADYTVNEAGEIDIDFTKWKEVVQKQVPNR